MKIDANLSSGQLIIDGTTVSKECRDIKELGTLIENFYKSEFIPEDIAVSDAYAIFSSGAYSRERFEIILDYEYFVVFDKFYHSYYYVSDDSDGKMSEHELKLIAAIQYSVANDIRLTDEELIKAFEADVTGEQVTDNGINYLYFKFKNKEEK